MVSQVLDELGLQMADELSGGFMVTVKILNFRTSENFAVIYLKFKQRSQILGYFIKKMQME